MLLKNFITILSSMFFVNNFDLPQQVTSILYVCKGNLCRSPFAEYLSRKIIQKKGIRSLKVESAGLQVNRSRPSPKEALIAAESFGIDMRAHKSKKIEANMINNFDIIVVMEIDHLEYLKRQFPAQEHKFFLLPLFQGRWNIFKNIKDPYGQGLEVYFECFKEIEKSIIALFKALEKTDVS